MARQIEQPIDFRNADTLRPIGNFRNFVSGADLPFFNHAEVKPRPLMGNEQRGHLRVIHPYADAIASNPGLSHFEECASDPVAISDADLTIGEPIDSEVLAELAILKVLPLQVLLPVAIRVELIHHQGAVLPAVSCEVPLAIAIEIETSRHHLARDRSFKNSGAHHLALPRDIARQPDIHGDELIHFALSDSLGS